MEISVEFKMIPICFNRIRKKKNCKIEKKESKISVSAKKKIKKKKTKTTQNEEINIKKGYHANGNFT